MAKQEIIITKEQLDGFVARCQELLDRYYEENFPSVRRPQLTAEPGQRYARIVSHQESQRSCWAFVDLTNGDVLKPAGWKGPAKHSRGNILDDQGGMAHIGPYGPAYLK